MTLCEKVYKGAVGVGLGCALAFSSGCLRTTDVLGAGAHYRGATAGTHEQAVAGRVLGDMLIRSGEREHEREVAREGRSDVRQEVHVHGQNQRQIQQRETQREEPRGPAWTHAPLSSFDVVYLSGMGGRRYGKNGVFGIYNQGVQWQGYEGGWVAIPWNDVRSVGAVKGGFFDQGNSLYISPASVHVFNRIGVLDNQGRVEFRFRKHHDVDAIRDYILNKAGESR